MTLGKKQSYELESVIQKLINLWVPHESALGEQVRQVRFALPSDGIGLYCSYCNEQEIGIQSLSLCEVSALRWASDCTHVPNLSSLIACIENTDLASTLVDIMAIRQPRTYDFTLGSDPRSSSREALTIGMAYSTFQQFVSASLWNFEKRDYSIHADVIRQEISDARTFLDNVHVNTVGSERIRELLRDEASKMVDLSSSTTMGWIVLGYIKVSIADNYLLHPQTVARALQASFAPKSLHDDEIVCIPFWVADAISTLAPEVIKSQFHMKMPVEVIRAAETLWREADGGIFANFDESVAAARLLS